MSSTWQESTVTELVPSKIMKQNEAKAIKTGSSVHLRINSDLHKTTNVKGQMLKTNVTFTFLVILYVQMFSMHGKKTDIDNVSISVNKQPK